MSNPLTKYVAAAAVAGVVAFGGFTIAGAQDGGSTTTTTPPASQGERPEGQAPGQAGGQRTDGERPEGCDRDKGEAGSTATPEATPQTESSNTQSSFTST